MSVQEAQKEIAAMRAAGERLRKSPARARKFLLKYKLITPSGKLAKRFRE